MSDHMIEVPGDPQVRISNLIDAYRAAPFGADLEVLTAIIGSEHDPRARADAFKSGSKLWALQWAHADNDALLTAKQYATEALSYLVNWGIVSTLIITPFYITRSVIQLHISIAGPGVSSAFVVEGQAMAKADWLWREYQR